MSSYKDLEVYKRSYKAVKEIYEVTQGFPKEEQYGITSQMRRAAVSIALTIAEGYGKREGTKELVRFIRMARGSNCEMEVLLELAKDLEYISLEEYEKQAKEYEQIGKMLTGLIKSLTNS